MLYFYQKKTALGQFQIINRFSRFKLKIRLLVPAQEAKVAAPLSPILGQFGLSCSDFCKRFNEESSMFVPGLLVVVHLEVLPYERAFRFSIRNLCFTSLIHSVTGSNTEYYLSIVDLYRLVVVYTFLFKRCFWSSVMIIVGTIRAGPIRIVT